MLVRSLAEAMSSSADVVMREETLPMSQASVETLPMAPLCGDEAPEASEAMAAPSVPEASEASAVVAPASGVASGAAGAGGEVTQMQELVGWMRNCSKHGSMIELRQMWT